MHWLTLLIVVFIGIQFCHAFPCVDYNKDLDYEGLDLGSQDQEQSGPGASNVGGPNGSGQYVVGSSNGGENTDHQSGRYPIVDLSAHRYNPRQYAFRQYNNGPYYEQYNDPYNNGPYYGQYSLYPYNNNYNNWGK